VGLSTEEGTRNTDRECHRMDSEKKYPFTVKLLHCNNFYEGKRHGSKRVGVVS